MKRIIRAMVNWLVIIGAPFWVFLLFWFWIMTDYDYSTKLIFAGKKWIWEK